MLYAAWPSCATASSFGTITVDDLLIDLAADLADLARPVTAEVLFGHHEQPLPATT